MNQLDLRYFFGLFKNCCRRRQLGSAKGSSLLWRALRKSPCSRCQAFILFHASQLNEMTGLQNNKKIITKQKKSFHHKHPLPYTTVYVFYLCVELLLRCIMFCHAWINRKRDGGMLTCTPPVTQLGYGGENPVLKWLFEAQILKVKRSGFRNEHPNTKTERRVLEKMWSNVESSLFVHAQAPPGNRELLPFRW